MDASSLALLAALPEEDIPAPGALPVGSRMGLRRNPVFVGREEELRTLARALKGGATVGIGQAAGVTGLGGVGKTQLASEFVHRYGRYFAGGVFWLSFSEAANVPSEVAACGSTGTLTVRPDYAELPQAEQVALVRAAWDKEMPRLLVFDNCEAEELLQAWLPAAGSGSRVLLTSRRAAWSRRVSVQAIPLGTLPREDSVALLAKFRPDLAGNPALDAIAARLGDLPLALHLAGSYLERYQPDGPLGDPARYLEALSRPDLLMHPSMQGRGSAWNPTDHEQSVARTFALSTDRLAKSDAFEDHLALALLARAAHFAPAEPIPRPLLVATLQRPDSEETALENADALKRLLDLGLVEQGEAGALTLHRLLVLFAKESNEKPLLDVVERVVDEEATRLNEAGYPLAARPLLPHLRHLTDEALTRADERAASLCHKLGQTLFNQGAYTAARPYYEHGLAIRHVVLGQLHPDTAQSFHSLAYLLAHQGDYKGARQLGESSLVIREEVLGLNHPDTIRSLSHLGWLLCRQGEYNTARSHCERALHRWKQVMGVDQLGEAETLTHLGGILFRQGDLVGALAYREQALATVEQLLGKSHPLTAIHRGNLGYVLYCQGDYAAAQHCHEQALQVYEEVLGPSHPATAQGLYNLAKVFEKQQNYLSALSYHQRALVIREEALGVQHPNVAYSLESLGEVLMEQGDYGASQLYLERALKTFEEGLGSHHPDTAHNLQNLGRLLYRQGNYVGAHSYHQRSLTIFKEVLGSTHPDTRQAQDNFQKAAKALRGRPSPRRRR